MGQSTDETLPPELRDRLDLLLQESGNDPLELRAGLERWFDEAMGRLSDAYRKQAVSMLGLIGFALAVATNASVPDVASRLWNASVTRAAVVAAAQNAAQGKGAETVAEVARTTDRLAELAVPLGWVGGAPTGFGWWAGHLLGWGLTAVLVMVGAPFWFELLGRLVTFRVGGSGGQPPRADQDPAAATPRVMARDLNPAAAPDAPVPESPLLAHVRGRGVPLGALTPLGGPAGVGNPQGGDTRPRLSIHALPDVRLSRRHRRGARARDSTVIVTERPRAASSPRSSGGRPRPARRRRPCARRWCRCHPPSATR